MNAIILEYGPVELGEWLGLGSSMLITGCRFDAGVRKIEFRVEHPSFPEEEREGEPVRAVAEAIPGGMRMRAVVAPLKGAGQVRPCPGGQGRTAGESGDG